MTKTKQLTLNELKEIEMDKKKNEKAGNINVKEVKGPYELPEGWKWVRLGDVSIINPSKKEISNLPSEIEVSFVPMAYVDENSGTIINQDVKKLKEVRQGYTYFKEGDILFAKITPCMENGKCAVAKGLINGIGFGSTEFHVIRPKDEYILSEYIRLYLRQKWVRAEATRYFTGAVGQQRVPDSFLKKLPIPIPFKNNKPDLEEQKRIVAKIEGLFRKIDRIKELRRQAKEEAENLLNAALHHVFSRADEKGWRWVKLRDVAQEDRNQIDPKDYPEKEFWLLTMDCVESNTGKLLQKVVVKGKEIKSVKFRFNSSHILFGKLRPYLNKVYIPDGEGLCTTEFIPLLPKENIDRCYLALFLRTPLVVNYAMRNLTGARQPRVDLNAFYRLPVPLPFKNNKPDLEEQKRIASYLDKIAEKQRKLLELYEQTEKELEVMKQAILSKAFRGQL